MAPHNIYGGVALSLGGAVLLAACGGGGGDDPPTPGPANGTLRVQMTDAPACGYDHVYVTVNRVRVNGSPDADDNGSGWVDIPVSPAQRIDLLSLTNGVLATLGQTALPAGNYQQIRLVLSPNSGNALSNSVVPTGGTETALDTPSAAQSGYKIIRPFTVAPDTLTDLILDFDACKSVVPRGNGGYNLKPVVTALPVVVSGKVSGALTPAQAGATVYAERGGLVVKSTVADANGNFVLSPIEQSTSSGNVDVVIVPTGRATGIVRSVPVVAGSNTVVSTQGAPIDLPVSTIRTASGTVSPASAQASLRAIQNTSGQNFTISTTFANVTSGAYSMALPAAAPMVGTYSTTLPIPLTAASTAAGKYTIEATSINGPIQTQPADVSGGNVGANFAF
ncbi:hypothetical protein D3C87_1192010 [compost metagenome]|jgi:hypothetical protein|uniref:DUF4382 domain-containing protein n=1 Tax=Cupriavidus campinensis TaxID=151783 RepID=A0ABY3ETC6_9BURK|nr:MULTISPECIES: DUF4382 domain-containing protein [Cupriavidus]TSP14233.1 DUF4382 domain-containing protein [Cupriavidus campinensis]CAG2155909.1 hypothetical protein LMG19282_05058 [Cupriavidus campinensis]